jgi:hypothetical protein
MAAPSGSYSLIRQGVSTSTAITVNQVLAPAASAIEITRAEVTQDNVTTTGQTRVQLNRNSTACTVTSATAGPQANGMQASKCVGGTSATGITATAEGTIAATPWSAGFNVVNGVLYLPVPEQRWLLVGSAAGFAALKLAVAPAAVQLTSIVEWLEYAA